MPNYIRVFTYILLFLFPATANLVEHGSSLIYTLLLLFGLIFWAARKKRPFFSRHEKILMATFAAYFAVGLISFLIRGLFDPQVSFEWDLDHELRFVGFVFIYYLLISSTGVKEWVLWYGVSAGAICSMIYALIQAYMLNPGMRVVGPYYPIGFGDLALVFGFMSFAGVRYFYRQNRKLVFIPILALGGGILSAFLSGTLGAMLAIPVLTGLFVVQLGEFSKPWRYRILTLIGIGIALTAYYQMANAPIHQRIHAELKEAKMFFNGSQDQLEGEQAYRLRVWSQGWLIYKDHPLLGVGKKQYRDRLSSATHLDRSHLHNMFFEYLINYGIFGFILFAVYFAPLLMLIFIISKAILSKGKDFAYAGLNLTAGFIVFALTECIFYRNLFISTYIIFTAVIFALINQSKTESLVP